MTVTTKVLGLVLGIGVSLSAASVLLFLLFRKNEEEKLLKDYDFTKTSRHSVAQVSVPKVVVGSVIGRQGENIKRIQEQTGTKINFNDPANANDDRIATIRGTTESVQEAEILIVKMIRDSQMIETYEMFIPEKSCGRVIGKNGDSIRQMCLLSRAKINVERSTAARREPNAQKRVTIRGSPAQIDMAKALIEEKLGEEDAFQQKPINEVDKSKYLSITAQADDTQPYGKSVLQVERLIPTGSDGFLEVLVSAVDNPSKFWLQIVGNRSRELDKLVEELTMFYQIPANREEFALDEVAVDDYVAAPFVHDGSWYRARVVSVEEDSYSPVDTKITVSYIDFGDTGNLTIGDCCRLDKAHLQFPFQAVECTLAKVKPKQNVWTEESSVLFEKLTYAAEWKPVMARPIKTGDYDSSAPQDVEIVDTNTATNVDVAEELVKQGFAEWVEDLPKI